MQLFSPDRPKLANGTPAYLTPDGRVAGPLSALYITPLESGGYEIGQHWCRGPNRASWFKVEVAGDGELLEFLAKWKDDPEETMRKEMGWEWSSASAGIELGAVVKAAATVEDMGL